MASQDFSVRVVDGVVGETNEVIPSILDKVVFRHYEDAEKAANYLNNGMVGDDGGLAAVLSVILAEDTEDDDENTEDDDDDNKDDNWDNWDNTDYFSLACAQSDNEKKIDKNYTNAAQLISQADALLRKIKKDTLDAGIENNTDHVFDFESAIQQLLDALKEEHMRFRDNSTVRLFNS